MDNTGGLCSLQLSDWRVHFVGSRSPPLRPLPVAWQPSTLVCASDEVLTLQKSKRILQIQIILAPAFAVWWKSARRRARARYRRRERERVQGVDTEAFELLRCLAACYHGHWLKVVRGHVSSLTLYIVLMMLLATAVLFGFSFKSGLGVVVPGGGLVAESHVSPPHSSPKQTAVGASRDLLPQNNHPPFSDVSTCSTCPPLPSTMTMELQELRDQLAQLQSENVRLQERLALRETPADSGASTSTDSGTTSSRHRTNGSPAEHVTIFGMVVPQRGILVVKEPFRQQASDGVKGVIGMNVIKECYYQLFSQHGSHLFDLPEIRLAPPLWQRALQHCHRMESQTLQPERGVAKVRGTALLEPLDDCQSLQQGLLISPAMVNIHQARPGTPLPNEVQLAIKCTSVATQCAMSVIPKRSTDDVKVLQQADPAIAPVLAFIQRQCAPGRMEREALDPAARSPTSGQLRPRVTGWTPTSPTYGQPCPQLTVWTTTKTLYPSDSRPAS
uniref:Uncharacterized protein n=1 Tax=Knipowitschia caucasica TaxID=637954 RepID=A0AAV2KYC7_KNICA